MAGFFRRTRTEEYTAPKTVLGFYAGVLAILQVGAVGATAVLATNDSLHYLIPWTLGFAAIVFVLLIGVVILINVRDPTKLQLGRISGREFLDYQRVTRGDSIAGEYVEEVPDTLPSGDIAGTALPAQRPAIEVAAATDEEEAPE